MVLEEQFYFPIAGSIGELVEVEVTLDLGSGDQEVTPPEGADGISKATVKKPSTLIPRNIRAGTTIAGVTGDLEPDKPDQTKQVYPTEQLQTIIADTGYELASVIIQPILTETLNTNQNGTFTPSANHYFKQAIINVPVPRLTEIEVTSSSAQQLYTPDPPYNGFGLVTVKPVPTETISTITVNGHYETTSGKWANAFDVNVPTYITVASEGDLPSTADDGTIAIITGGDE